MAPLTDEASARGASPFDITNLIARSAMLVRRDTYSPGHGTVDGTSIPNIFIFALLGLISASFVVTGVWFFFRAKNGGFHWGENDWEDYKSTVFRRRGPNGTTLSGATESTDLGGGSVYKDYDGHDAQTTAGSEMSHLKRKIKGKKRSKNGKEKRARLRGGEGQVDLEANTAYEPSYEPSHMGTTVDEDIRAYRHEKPARVGGINKAPDSSRWDGSTAPGGTDAHSDLLSHQDRRPTQKEKTREYTGGIRQVSNASTFWGTQRKRKAKREDRTPEMSQAAASTNGNSEYIQEEARRLQNLGRAAKHGGRGARDFSFQYGDELSHASASDADPASASAARREARRKERRDGARASRSPEKRRSQSPSKRGVPGGNGGGGGGYEYGSVMSDDDDGDLGTKSYHHPIPGLSELLGASGGASSVQGSEVSGAGGGDYAAERRKRRAEARAAPGGYRRA